MRGHREADALEAAEREAIIALTPTTLPHRLNSGPPELPGLTAASVWSALSTNCDSTWSRSSALTMPCEAENVKPSGLPIATTSSPTSSFSHSGRPRRF